MVAHVVSEISKRASLGLRVLWLLSGGSAIDVQIEIASRLSPDEKKHITVAQVDERYVQIGSEDDNWQQMTTRGFPFDEFSEKLRILHTHKSSVKCGEDYQAVLQNAFARTNFSIGIYGIGTDGHTAGIKPTMNDREFSIFKDTKLVAAYKASDFERITTTTRVIDSLDRIAVFCCDSKKKNMLKKLATDVPEYKMPAQLLKYAKNVVIFT